MASQLRVKLYIGRTIGSMFNPVTGGPDAMVNLKCSVKNFYDALLVRVDKKFSNRWGFKISYTPRQLMPMVIRFFRFRTARLIRTIWPWARLGAKWWTASIDVHWVIQSRLETWAFADINDHLWCAHHILLLRWQQPHTAATAQCRWTSFSHRFRINALIAQIYNGGGIAGVGKLPFVCDDPKSGDSFNSLDVRLSKTFKIGKRAEGHKAFKLFNITNRGFAGYKIGKTPNIAQKSFVNDRLFYQ